MNFFKLLSATQSMMKSCSRSGCRETFIHGYSVPVGGDICKACGDEFLKVLNEDKQTGIEFTLRARKYVDADIIRFLRTPRGEVFTPSPVADEDAVVAAHDVFYRKRVEVLDAPSEEEYSWETRMREIDKKWEARFTMFHDHPDFSRVFRKLLSECPEETLVELMKCAEFHATRHGEDPFGGEEGKDPFKAQECEDCQDSDDGVELEHQARGLGAVWLQTVQDLQLTVSVKPLAANEDIDD